MSSQLFAFDFKNPLGLPEFAKNSYGGTLPSLQELQCFADKKIVLSVKASAWEKKLANAFQYSILSGLAYYDFEEVKNIADALGYSVIEQIHEVNKKIEGNNVVYVDSSVLWLESETEVVLAFQGTNPKKIHQLITDAQFLQVPFASESTTFGKAHNGFVNNVEAVWPRIEKKLRELQTEKNLHIVGHSLGGATGILAAIKISNLKLEKVSFLDVYTFGCPRVGDKELVASVPKNTYRFVHYNDGVARIPPTPETLLALGLSQYFPEYYNTGELIYIDGEGNLLSDKEATANAISDTKLNVLRQIIDHDIRFYMEYLYRNVMTHKSQCI